MEITVDLKLDISGIEKLEKRCKSITKKHIKFGWINGKKYPMSTTNGGIPIADIASKHEFGTGVHQRPYFRQTINTARNSHNNDVANIFLHTLYNINTQKPLKTLADGLVNDYVNSVARQNYKSLSPVTVAIKGHPYQMLDTGIMMRNFESKVYRIGLK